MPAAENFGVSAVPELRVEIVVAVSPEATFVEQVPPTDNVRVNGSVVAVSGKAVPSTSILMLTGTVSLRTVDALKLAGTRLYFTSIHWLLFAGTVT